MVWLGVGGENNRKVTLTATVNHKTPRKDNNNPKGEVTGEFLF